MSAKAGGVKLLEPEINLDQNKVDALVKVLKNLEERVKNVLENVPVYIVSSRTMDSCVPPKQRIGIDPDCVSKEIQQKGIDLADAILDEELLEKCERDFKRSVAMGAFLPNGCRGVEVSEPAIFITLERIKEISEEIASTYNLNKGEVFRSLLKIVLVHEAGHASHFKLMKDPFKYDYNPGLRAIKETFAQLFAYESISERERDFMVLLSRLQPAEYRAFIPLSDHSEDAMEWINKICEMKAEPPKLLDEIQDIVSLWPMEKKVKRVVQSIRNRMRKTNDYREQVEMVGRVLLSLGLLVDKEKTIIRRRGRRKTIISDKSILVMKDGAIITFNNGAIIF